MAIKNKTCSAVLLMMQNLLLPLLLLSSLATIVTIDAAPTTPTSVPNPSSTSTPSPTMMSPQERLQSDFFCDFIKSTNIANLRNRGIVAGWMCANDEFSNLMPIATLSLPLCEWTGVTCADAGLVSGLDLKGLGLVGTLPTSISSLSRITQLVLADNDLYGFLPSELGSLVLLESLCLQHNSFQSTIPSSFGSLTSLRILLLNNNNLIGDLHSNLGNIGSSLEFLNIANNMLVTTFPQTFSQFTRLWYLQYSQNSGGGCLPTFLLPSLRYLYAENSGLTSYFPAVIGQMTRLKILSAQGNKIEGTLPESLSALTNLEIMRLSNNRITKLISNLGNMRALREVDLYNNYLSSSIPPSIGRLHNLVFLGLSNNYLEGSIPDTLFTLTSLEEMHLRNNLLVGGVPMSIGRLTRLMILDISYNRLDGSISKDLGNCTALELLYLGYNKIIGTIPPSFGDLIRLTDLYLTRNLLVGPIPQQMSQLVNIYAIDLQLNRLTSSIPFSLNSFKYARYVYLNNNMLEGRIGHLSTLGELEGGVELYLSDNMFTGHILFSSSGVDRVSTLKLANNFFTGPAPGPAKNVWELQNNFFSGAVPVCSDYFFYSTTRADYSHNHFDAMSEDIFRYCLKVNYFDVSYNMISSPAPSFAHPRLYSWDSLAHLDLSHNLFYANLTAPHRSWYFSGYFSLKNNFIEYFIPRNIFINSSQSFSVFDVSQNLFRGAIPNYIYAMHIQYFDISQNSFVGTLPYIRSNAYRVFDISDNRMDGPVPVAFASALAGSSLSLLGLAGNSFNGTLPQGFSQMTSLKTCDVSSNRFSGTLPRIGPSVNNLITYLSVANNNFTHVSASLEWPFYSSLLTLDLSSNDFIGLMPDVGVLTKLSSLSFAANSYSGIFPLSLSALTSLQFLDLSDNPMLNSPQSFPKLKSAKLKALLLSNDNLGGTFSSMSSAFSSSVRWENLNYLDISGNQISGNLSDREAIVKFSGLNYLNLQNNRFTGTVPYSLCTDLPNLTSFLIGQNDFECMPTCFRTISSFVSDFATTEPSFRPSLAPSYAPSRLPTTPPTIKPTTYSVFKPTAMPSLAPTTSSPTTERPTVSPTSGNPTMIPTMIPTTNLSVWISWCPEPTVSPTTAPTATPSAKPTGATSNPTSRPTHLLYDNVFANDVYYEASDFYRDPRNEVCQGDIIMKRLKTMDIIKYVDNNKKINNGYDTTRSNSIYEVVASTHEFENDDDNDIRSNSSYMDVWSYWCDQHMSSYEFPLLFSEVNLLAVINQREQMAAMLVEIKALNASHDGNQNSISPSRGGAGGVVGKEDIDEMLLATSGAFSYDFSSSYSSSSFLNSEELHFPSFPPTASPTLQGPTFLPSIAPTVTPSTAPTPISSSGDACFDLGNYWCYSLGCRLSAEIPLASCTGGGNIPAKCPDNAVCSGNRYTCNPGYIDNYANNNPGGWANDCENCKIPHTCISIAPPTPTQLPTHTFVSSPSNTITCLDIPTIVGAQVSASGVAHPVYDPNNVFDSDPNTVWLSAYDSPGAANNLPQWVRVSLPFSLYVNSYKVESFNSNSYYASQAARDWIFQGSNDGVTWVDLDSRSGIYPAVNTIYSYDIGSAQWGFFSSFRLYVTNNNGWVQSNGHRMALVNTLAICGYYSAPTVAPSFSPSTAPSAEPSVSPTERPTAHPTVRPTARPTAAPSTAIPTTPGYVSEVAGLTSVFASGPRLKAVETLVDCPTLLTSAEHSSSLKMLPIASQVGWAHGKSSIYQQISLPGSFFEPLLWRYINELMSAIAVNRAAADGGSIGVGVGGSSYLSPLEFILSQLSSVLIHMKGGAIGGSGYVSIASAYRRKGNANASNSSKGGGESTFYGCRSSRNEVLDRLCTPPPSDLDTGNPNSNPNAIFMKHSASGWTSADVTPLVVCQLITRGVFGGVDGGGDIIDYSHISASEVQEGNYSQLVNVSYLEDFYSNMSSSFSSSSASLMNRSSGLFSSSAFLEQLYNATGNKDIFGFDAFMNRLLANMSAAAEESDTPLLRAALFMLFRKSFVSSREVQFLYYKDHVEGSGGEGDLGSLSTSTSNQDSMTANFKQVSWREQEDAATGTDLSEWYSSQSGKNAPIVSVFFKS